MMGVCKMVLYYHDNVNDDLYQHILVVASLSQCAHISEDPCTHVQYKVNMEYLQMQNQNLVLVINYWTSDCVNTPGKWHMLGQKVQYG